MGIVELFMVGRAHPTFPAIMSQEKKLRLGFEGMFGGTGFQPVQAQAKACGYRFTCLYEDTLIR